MTTPPNRVAEAGPLAAAPAGGTYFTFTGPFECPAGTWTPVGFAVAGIPDGATALASVLGIVNLVPEQAAGIIAQEAPASAGEIFFLVYNYSPDPIIGGTITIFGHWFPP